MLNSSMWQMSPECRWKACGAQPYVNRPWKRSRNSRHALVLEPIPIELDADSDGSSSSPASSQGS